MNRELLGALANSLILTLVFETGFFLLTGKRNKKDLLLTGLVNAVTNPAVVLMYWMALLYTDLNRAAVAAALELSAVFIEGRYYKKYGQEFRRPYLFSAAANVVSFGIGALIRSFI